MKLPNLIIADECAEYEIIELLRQQGIPVISIMESNSGVKDIDVLKIAVEHEALLLTEDKDFGELVFRLNLTHHGILLLRFSNGFNPEIKAQSVLKTIQEKFISI